MRQRVISAIVLVPVVAAVFLAGQPWLTLGVALLAFVAAGEAFRLLQRANLPVDPGIGVFAAPVAVLGTLIAKPPAGLPEAFVVLVIVLAAIAAFRRPQARDGFLDWVGSTFGALYVSLLAFIPGVMLAAPAVPRTVFLGHDLGAGRTWLLVLVLTVWSFDSFAFLVGRALGGRRFLPHISPHKTWAGVVGGTVAAVVACSALTVAAGKEGLLGALLGLVVSITAQAGDVAESLLKRGAGAKDSGTLIPGHGGILDRLDSFIFAAPAFYLCLVLVPGLAPGTPA